MWEALLWEQQKQRLGGMMSRWWFSVSYSLFYLACRLMAVLIMWIIVWISGMWMPCQLHPVGGSTQGHTALIVRRGIGQIEVVIVEWLCLLLSVKSMCGLDLTLKTWSTWQYGWIPQVLFSERHFLIWLSGQDPNRPLVSSLPRLLFLTEFSLTRNMAATEGGWWDRRTELNRLLRRLDGTDESYSVLFPAPL